MPICSHRNTNLGLLYRSTLEHKLKLVTENLVIRSLMGVDWDKWVSILHSLTITCTHTFLSAIVEYRYAALFCPYLVVKNFDKY